MADSSTSANIGHIPVFSGTTKNTGMMCAPGREKPRRILFYGWGAAAAISLRTASLQKCKVLIISHTNQAKDCNLADIAHACGFEILLTDKVDPHEAMNFQPDLICSASYRMRIPQRVLDLAPNAINFHPSLLPKHRGCFSSFHVLFDDDKKTGVTCHRMVLDFDKGEIIDQVEIPVKPDSTCQSLYVDLLQPTADCFERVISYWIETGGELMPGRPQEGTPSYHYRKLPFDGIIQKNWDLDTVGRFIRAMTFPPLEGAVMYTDDGQRHVVECLSDYIRLTNASPITCSTNEPS